ncbi:MAG: DUF1846 domain-containing protein [Candidatus Omnitrophica bacterium]|nr:DUF1846 domain-containing protein [Candidatus Omnitrophota bacterium]MBU4589344.1 DUF1846 domain-containing protein [Candidatus Omnitrophota bacterium]
MFKRVVTKKVSFDNEKYLREQTKEILGRVKKFDNKLYLEFGGKICFDYHAARVLPGYDPNVKMRLLEKLKKYAEIVVSVYAKDIEQGRVRGDYGITYDLATLKLIDDLKAWNLDVASVVLTRFNNEPAAVKFKRRLEKLGLKVYKHLAIEGYPHDVEKIVSPNGYGKNEYIETKKPLVVVTAPGPGSGKLATCLSQFYHDHIKGINSGYAKFETFPIWNLPLNHPVNIAYEAATVDLADFNLIDPFHLEKYRKNTVNYNRDVDAFPILRKIIHRITDSADSYYNSPTDMGVNRAGFGIIDDKGTREAAKEEIIRRYFRHNLEFATGAGTKEELDRAASIMDKAGVEVENRKVVLPARKAAGDCEKKGKGNKGYYCGAAIELAGGEIITGKNSPLMHAASAAIINAIKHLGGIKDDVHILKPEVMEDLSNLRKHILSMTSESLTLDEILVALSISAHSDKSAKKALSMLKDLSGCELHNTHLPPPGDEAGLRRLGINFTTDAIPSSSLFFNY